MTQILFSKPAQKFLNKQSKKNITRIMKAINQIPYGDIKKLKGYNNSTACYRLRVGDYRIIYTSNGEIICIEKIGNRGDVYK